MRTTGGATRASWLYYASFLLWASATYTVHATAVAGVPTAAERSFTIRDDTFHLDGTPMQRKSCAGVLKSTRQGVPLAL